MIRTLFGRRPRRRLLIQNGHGDEHAHLLSLTRDLHARYCRRHSIKYLPTSQGAADSGKPAHWAKIDLLMEGLRQGYDQVCWLDTDCVIVDPETNVFEASGYGIAVCECYDSPTVPRHLNTGFILVTDGPRVREFLRIWSEASYEGAWADQGAFIALMASRPHRELLTIIPNRYNCVDVHMEDPAPVIRAFHGDPQRTSKIAALMAEIAT